MPASSRRRSISASSSPPGTGTSSTWSGCSCSWPSMSGAMALKAPQQRVVVTAAIDQGRFFPEGAAAAPPLFHSAPLRWRGAERAPMTTAPVSLSDTILRGLACKCPRCGEGKLFAGFLSLRPSCSACGLDYAFIDAGDGPAVFIILIAGFIVVFCALIVEVVYQPPFWLHAVLWVPLVL